MYKSKTTFKVKVYFKCSKGKKCVLASCGTLILCTGLCVWFSKREKNESPTDSKPVDNYFNLTTKGVGCYLEFTLYTIKYTAFID